MNETRKYMFLGAAAIIFLLISIFTIRNLFYAGDFAENEKLNLKSENTNSEILSPSTGPERKLKMVQMIWRHGDRAPAGLPYPNDKNDEKMWPRGWTQLTNKGIREARNLGKFFRNYYKSSGFLQEFNKDQIYIQSSNTERTIMTAQAFSAGCFPPTGNSIWDNSSLSSWQPTPIHTSRPGSDPLLNNNIKCPNYRKIHKKEKRIVARKIDEEYAELFKMLQIYTGKKSEIRYGNVDNLYSIQREIYHKMKQPKWVFELWKNKTIIEHLIELKRITMNQYYNSKEKAKLKGGFLVNKLIQNMLDYNSNLSTINTYLYSSHDTTLNVLGYALNVSDHQLVHYVATYILELYDDDTVQILYRNSNANPHSLIIPGCEQFCPLDKFVKLLENVRVKSLKELFAICGI
ncbi:unnamed protein product [Caenorhabditis angaria]|uniref:Uncharacterized protein n=1 Tax=Caenorhabditis angaria TaxID=860376 RepID=A0A9P1I6H7_9PELO|nr:unnamed protein product [Caenorhabditis angaria]